MAQQSNESNNPVFDEGAIGRLVGDTAEKKARFLRLFLDRSETLVDQIREGAQSGDLDALGGAAHQLKSTSASIGGMSLSALAAAIEAYARDGDGDGMEMTDALAELPNVYQATCHAIQATLGQLDQELSQTPDGNH